MKIQNRVFFFLIFFLVSQLASANPPEVSVLNLGLKMCKICFCETDSYQGSISIAHKLRPTLVSEMLAFKVVDSISQIRVPQLTNSLKVGEFKKVESKCLNMAKNESCLALEINYFQPTGSDIVSRQFKLNQSMGNFYYQNMPINPIESLFSSNECTVFDYDAFLVDAFE